MTEPLLQMCGIDKAFPGVQALAGVDFALHAGEVHALMGENGAGKSTLIKVLTAVHPRDAGEVLLEDRPIDPGSPKEAEALGISTVYQEINLIPHLSVAENICLGRQPSRFGFLDWAAVRRRAERALERLELALDVTRELSSCSVAIQQMVSIARALDVEAKLLILDEPTSSLDEREVAELFQLMRRLREQGLGIVFITHFLDQVYEISDRITVLRNGELVGEFPTPQLPRLALIGHMLGKDPRELESLQATVAATPAGAGEALLQARGLGRKGAVEPLELDVAKGEVVGLAGLLGSGRTETARLLFGIDRVDSGEVRVGGRLLASPPALRRWLNSFPRGTQRSVGALWRWLRGFPWKDAWRRHSPRGAIAHGLAFCSEDRKTEGIIPHLSVRENIILAIQGGRGALRTLSRTKQRALAAHYIQALSIKTPSMETPLQNLSGGNQQKVLLARWLALQPQLIILDEPTRGIDVGAKAEIEKLVADLRERGMAVLFISSELEEVVRACQRVVVLRDRRKIGELGGPGERAIDEHVIMDMIAHSAEDPAEQMSAS